MSKSGLLTLALAAGAVYVAFQLTNKCLEDDQQTENMEWAVQTAKKYCSRPKIMIDRDQYPNLKHVLQTTSSASENSEQTA